MINYTLTLPSELNYTVPAAPSKAAKPSINFFNKAALTLIDKTDTLYVPIFNLYHRLKENTFLTTEDKSSIALEKAGNFFLRPVRYLLNGKTFENDKLTLCYDYSHDTKETEFLKTALSIAALPISLLIGATLKALCFLSADFRQRHQKIENTIFSTKITPYDYQSLGIRNLYSNEVLAHQNFPFPAANPKQEEQMGAVHAVAELLEKHNIPHWLDCGTLIGARRHGSMIPWDTDVDMGVPAPEFHNVMHALRELDPKKYQVQDWSSSRCPEMFIRVLIKESNSYLDIYHHAIDPAAQTMQYKYSWTDSPWIIEPVKKRELVQEKPIPLSDVFPLKTAQFGKKICRVPGNWEPFLKVKYGPNLDPCKVWNAATGEYDKVPGHPYWQHSDF